MKSLCKLFIVFSIFVLTAQAKYVCTQDQAFQDWLAQEAVDVNDDLVLVKYSDNISCKSQCRMIRNCLTTSSVISKNVAPMATSYTEDEKNALEAFVNGKNITFIKISTPEGTVVDDLTNFNGSSFVFPTGNASGGTLSRTVYSGGGTVINTYKLYPYEYSTDFMVTSAALSNTDRNNINNSVNNLIASDAEVIGFEIDSNRLIFHTSLNQNGFQWNTGNGTETIFGEGSYNIKLVTDSANANQYYIQYDYAGVTKYAFKDTTSSTIKVIYKKKSANVAYRVKIAIGSDIYLQSNDYTSDASGSVFQNKQVGLTVIFDSNGYTCPQFDSNVDLGGDIDLNIFSDETSCNNECYVQYGCIEWTDHPQCTPTSFVKSNPVSDYTGKTVLTKYSITWDCNVSEVVDGECLAYTTEVLDDNTTFDLSGIGWKSKEFAGADEAMTGVASLEQLQHIWSGWNGMCENGTLYDDSWMSDPATLLSFAMMAYTGALEGAYGSTLQSGAQEIQSGVDTVGQSFDSMTTFGDSTENISVVGSETTIIDDGTTITSVGAEATATSVFEQITGLSDTIIFDQTSITSAVHASDLIMNAASIVMAGMSDPVPDDLTTADDFMKAQLGGTDASIAAVNYVQCMASIGLSFPNMVGHAVDSNNSTSAELREPWKNIITISDHQLAELMHATSASFVSGSFLLSSHNDETGIGKYVATSSVAYTQAGQVICGNGNVALAMNINNQMASDNSGGGGMNGGAMAMAAVGAVISYLPPPYNLIGSIILKILTSFSSGDACTDEDIAMKWGIQQFKTNKAFNFNQCHYTDSECAAEWAWGSCMRTRNFYCCYDQEMTKIFVEGVKAQIPRAWFRNQCDDLGIEDLKNISFRKCLTEESPVEDKCFPQSSWNELNDAIRRQTTQGFDGSSLANMAIDSMPIGDDPWGPRVGD